MARTCAMPQVLASKGESRSYGVTRHTLSAGMDAP